MAYHSTSIEIKIFKNFEIFVFFCDIFQPLLGWQQMGLSSTCHCMFFLTACPVSNCLLILCGITFCQLLFLAQFLYLSLTFAPNRMSLVTFFALNWHFFPLVLFPEMQFAGTPGVISYFPHLQLSLITLSWHEWSRSYIGQIGNKEYRGKLVCI